MSDGVPSQDMFINIPQYRSYIAGQMAAAGFGGGGMDTISNAIVESTKAMLSALGVQIPAGVSDFFAKNVSTISSALTLAGYNALGTRLADYLPITQQAISGMMLYNAMPFTGFLSPEGARSLGASMYNVAGQLMDEAKMRFPGYAPSDVIGAATYYTERGRGIMWDMLSGNISARPNYLADIDRSIMAVGAMRNLYGANIDARMALGNVAMLAGYNIGGASAAQFATELLSYQRMAYNIPREDFTRTLEIAAQDARARGIPEILGTRAAAAGMAVGGLMTLMGSPLLPETNVRIASQQLMRGFTSYGAQLLGGLVTGTLIQGAEILGPEAANLSPVEIAKRLNAPRLEARLREITSGEYRGVPSLAETTQLLGEIGISPNNAARIISMTQANQMAAGRYVNPMAIFGMQQAELGAYAGFITRGAVESVGLRLSEQAVGRLSNLVAQGIDFFNPESINQFSRQVNTILRESGIRSRDTINEFTQRLMTGAGAFFSGLNMYDQYAALGALNEARRVMETMSPEVQAKFSGLLEIAGQSGRMQPFITQFISNLTKRDTKGIVGVVSAAWETLTKQTGLTGEEIKALEMYVQRYHKEGMTENVRNILKSIEISGIQGSNIKFERIDVERINSATGEVYSRESRTEK